jgi:hypothetical protein
MSNKIEQSLIEIEKNLEKIESARLQVNKVTNSSNDLAQSTVGLIREFKKIADVLNGQSGTFGTKLQQSETNFQKKIEELSLKWQKGTEAFLESMDKTNAKYRNNLDKSAENSSLKAKEILAQQEKFVIDNNKILKDFHLTLEAFKVRLEHFDFAQYLTPSKEVLNIFNNSLELFQKKLGEFDFTQLILPLDKKIENLEKRLNSQKNITYILLAVIILLGLANLL